RLKWGFNCVGEIKVAPQGAGQATYANEAKVISDPKSARALGAVLGAALLAAGHAHGVQRAADDVVANAREVLHTATADHHHRVLLEVVTHAGDVRGDLDPVRQTNTRHLAEGRVRLLRSGGVHAGADATLLRALLQRGALALDVQLLAALTDQLTNGWH